MGSYDQWLKEAQAWPCTSRCWLEEDVEQFLNAFQALVATKRTERDATLEVLQATIWRVSHDCVRSLTFVGWCLRPAPEPKPPMHHDEVEAWVAQSTLLVEELSAVEQCLAAPALNAFDSQQQWLAALQPHVAAARGLLGQLGLFFREIATVTEIPLQKVLLSALDSVAEPTQTGPAYEQPDARDEAEEIVRADTSEPGAEVELIPDSATAVILEAAMPSPDGTDMSLPSAESVVEVKESSPGSVVSDPGDAQAAAPEQEPEQEQQSPDAALLTSEAAEASIDVEPSAPASEPNAPLEDERRWVDSFVNGLQSSLVEPPDSDFEIRIETDSPELSVDVNALRKMFWDRVDDDDIAAAYWLARALEASGEESPITPKTVAAMQALRLYWMEPEELEAHCSLIFDYQEPTGDAGRLAVFASSMRMAVAAPNFAQTRGTSFELMLHGEPPFDELRPIVQAVRDYSSRYQPLRRRYAVALESAHLREAATRQATLAIKGWLEAATTKSMQMPAASDIYNAWAQPGGRMHKAALPILNNDFSAVAEVSRDAQWWAEEQGVEDALNEDHQKQQGSDSVDDIIGPSRATVWRFSREFSKLLKAWCDAVGYDNGGDGTMPPQVQILRDQLLAATPRLVSWMQQQQQNRAAADVAAARHLHREIASIYDALLLPPPLPAPHSRTVNESWYSGSKGSLDLALRRRLELVPGLEVGDELDIEERLPAIAIALAASTSAAEPATTMRQWLSRGDFRWIDRFLEALGAAPLAAELRNAADQRRAECSALLRAEVEAATQEVQEAAIGSWLPNANAERFNDELHSISPGSVLLFPPPIARVREIRRRCREALVARLAEFAERCYALYATLFEGESEPRLLSRLTALFHEMLDTHDVRAAGTFLIELAAVADRPERMSEALEKLIGVSPAQQASLFRRFLDSETAVSDWLFDNHDIWGAVPEDTRYLPDRILRATNTFLDGILIPPSSDSRRRESAQAIKDWMQLHSASLNQPDVAPSTIRSIAGILSFIGFDHQQIDSKVQGAGSLFLTARMSAGSHAPVPQWGSDSHEREHHILVMTKKPDAGMIRDRIAALPRHKDPLLLLYLEHLEPSARRELAAFARAERDPVLVFDDVLMLFLTQCAEHRLRSFFECALPFSSTNPYVKERNGPVAPEIFQGHKDAITKLMDRRGTCFICGGRQLGKSALQNYIQKQFDRQTPNRHVWHINVTNKFDPRDRQSANSIWPVLYDKFSEAGLLTRNAATTKPESMVRQIKQVFDRQPALDVTVFLDEADELLEAMISDRRHVWTALTTLMDDTQRRLKLIFAGNYHVSRFAAQRNQSATLMGTPIEIGPMEFAAATDLIEKPLQVLGYRIDRRAVLTILSLTHRHASLLQYFMHELLETKINNGTASGPPWDITSADVEKTYTPEVRQAMRQRIELTLELDPEYCALAYAMLLDQEGSGDFRMSYETTALKEKAEALWPQRFKALSNADVEARLNEMHAVGIVRRNGERFRLSGPHLISLFGDYATIRARAKDLIGKQPRSKFDESFVHGWLNRKTERYSPLTLVLERQLQHKQTQTRLLFLSPAGGLDEIDEVLKTLQEPSEDGNPVDCIIPDNVDSREAIIWLRAFRKKLGGSHGIALQHLRSTSRSVLLRHISEIQAHCRAVYNTGTTFQVAFILDPASGWAWHQSDEAERRPFEQSAIATVRWDALGIRSRLEDLGKIFTSQAADDVLRATSGWHLLLQSLFDDWQRKTDDPTQACQSLSSKLADPTNELTRRFASALGLQPDSPPQRALLGLLAYGEPITFDEALDLLDRDAGPAIEFLQHYGLITFDGEGRLVAEPLAAQIQSQPVGVG
jgi:hypothetical protein